MTQTNQNSSSGQNERDDPSDSRFLPVVIAACVFLLLALIAAYLLLHRDARKLAPHGPNPTPNSLVQPAPAVQRTA